MTILSVNCLKKSFLREGEKHIVLKNVSFRANKGEIIALLGSSGSGKSTLLRCINQLETPDSGEITIDNQTWRFTEKQPAAFSAKQLLALRLKVGMVFQQFNLWPHMTVLQNLIEAPITVLKQPKAMAISQAEKLLNRVDLLSKRNAYPAQLSGGQQQRVAILRAVMMNPKLLLFDEPVSALDPEMVSEVLQVMQQLAREMEMTLIIATHLVHFARAIADQVIFLEKGEILEHGPANQLFTQPQTERLQRFFASASLL